jgi:FOG: TPR repeat, SEL1 subfamily
MYNLGIMYATGSGTRPDNTQAAHWFTKAAEGGNADAQYNIAVMYDVGGGVPKDEKTRKC